VNAVTIRLADDATVVEVAGRQHVMPLGVMTLSLGELVSDPPRPEELTNAIGLVVDHLDDVVRALPDVAEADVVRIIGYLAAVISAVEFGGEPPLPFTLRRAAAEDVFRTVATESSVERATNPGLPIDAVGTIVAACCIVVGTMRHLHLDQIEVDAADTVAAVDANPGTSS
jgi:exopolyphosphatase / guanosine-5'-triphosphate,3'-diphosphate pyrophosphatase